MNLTKEDLQRIILEEISIVRMENLIKEITKRKFCQLMGLAGGALASGCGLDYELLNTKDNNEAGKPIPSCIQDPDIEPNLSDNSTWAGTPIKLYDFMAQPAFGKDDVYVSDDGDYIEVMILNVPSTADIWNSQAAIIQNSSPSWSEDQIINVYEVGGQPRHLVTVKIKFPIYTGEDGEEYVKHWSDGGNWGNIPQKNTQGCGLEYEEWLNPSKSLEEVVNEELLKVLLEKKQASSEKNLGDWFDRKGEKGSKGGWVDCNAPDGKGGYKECAQGKRKKKPYCRPTPSACKDEPKKKN